VNVAFVLTLAGVEDEQVEAALGQEELVGSVHDLLPAEVPDVEAYVARAPLTLSGDLPLRNIDAFGLAFLRIEFVLDQALNQRSLADAALADQQDLGFVERASDFAPATEVVGQDVGGIGGFGGFGFVNSRPEDFRRDAEGFVAVQEELLEIGQLLDFGGRAVN